MSELTDSPSGGLVSPGARGVLEVARSVLGDLDVERVFSRVLEAARELTGARYAAIGVLDESRSALARFVTAGIDESERQRIGPAPTGHGVLGEMIHTPVPMRLANVGWHPRSYGFPAGHPPMETFLGVPVMVDGEPFANLYLSEKAGGVEFTEADQEALVLLVNFAGVAIDHARRFSDSEGRRGQLERTVQALLAMVQISHAIGGQTDLSRILELVAKRGRTLISARALVIELRVDGGLEVAAGAGELPGDLVGQQIAIHESVAGAALRTGRTQRLEDPLNRARFEEHGLGGLGFKAEAGLVVPLIFQDESFGVLLALDRVIDGPRFTDQDARMLEAFASSAATAVATAQSVAAERSGQRLAAAEQERARWARELHDETLQNLASLRLGLDGARRVGGSPALEGAVAKAIDQLDGEIASVRSLITELRPAALDELGVEAAIAALASRAGEVGLDVELRIDLAYEQQRVTQRHTSELETAIYRIVQESLTNASKNGHARRAVVEVHEHGAIVEVSVSDDGIGFDSAAPTNGFGMIGMRERAELLLGTLEVESTPGRGTVVRATLPAQRRAIPPPSVHLASAG
jgi:signal transduction histidine kinase